MTPEEQIKALAELDGWIYIHGAELHENGWRHKDGRTAYENADLPAYLLSYDAIIPLIQKQILLHPNKPMPDTLQATPTQLCEALLRATGKWK